MDRSLKQVRNNGKPNNTNKGQAYQQARQERISDLVQQLEEGVAAIQSSDDFQRWLAVASRFHNYSLNNQLLIMLQYPTATRVAGYKTWQSLGRQVVKGAKGISILAPRPYERTVQDQDTCSEEVRSGLAFRSVCVFDISQTEGEPLPPPVKPTLLQQEQEGAEELYSVLVTLAAAQGLKVTSFDRLTAGNDSQSDYNGYYQPTSGLIFVKTAATGQMVKTLAHELGHHFDRTGTGKEGSVSSREERETVAEAVAFIVTSWYGLDSSTYSFPYVAGWAGKSEGTAVIKAVMSRIQQAAHNMLTLLEEEAEAEGVTAKEGQVG